MKTNLSQRLLIMTTVLFCSTYLYSQTICKDRYVLTSEFGAGYVSGLDFYANGILSVLVNVWTTLGQKSWKSKSFK
jgi:hypothetical protein